MASEFPETSLSAVTTGSGTAVDFLAARSDITMVIIPTGTVTGGTVALDVSQDGTNWVQHSVSGALATGVNQALTASSSAFRYGRGRVATTVTGGGTVTTTLMQTDY